MGSSDKNNPATDPQARDALNFASQNTKSGDIRNPFKYDDVINQIDNNHPFMMHISWVAGGGHMVVCAGYNKTNGLIQIIDPWPNNNPKYYDYQKVLENENIPINKGRCTSIIIY